MLIFSATLSVALCCCSLVAGSNECQSRRRAARHGKQAFTRATEGMIVCALLDFFV